MARPCADAEDWNCWWNVCAVCGVCVLCGVCGGMSVLFVVVWSAAPPPCKPPHRKLQCTPTHNTILVCLWYLLESLMGVIGSLFALLS